MTTDNIVEISNLKFAYGEREILKSIDLTIPRGKVVGIMGASGSGKSVLLKLTLGLFKPDAGRIHVNGRRLDTLSEQDLLAVRADIALRRRMPFTKSTKARRNRIMPARKLANWAVFMTPACLSLWPASGVPQPLIV